MSAAAPTPLLVGRYAIFDRIAAGGMAAVHIARLAGEGGFARTVAVKRLHPQFALDPEFVAMFLDEARLAARIRHPNVVATVDIVTADGELFLVMEYVEGESLSTLLRIGRERSLPVSVGVAAGVLAQALQGLHAAHEARSDLGEPLDLVHRDVSPQNMLVGTDGVVRVLDFGVAKALGKLHTTREGQLKGKLGYLAPEQVMGHPVTRRSDVFAAAVVLWEALAGHRLFSAESEGNVLRRIMDGVVEPPSKHAAGIPPALEAVVMRGLAREPADRFDTALAMAEAMEAAMPLATTRAVGQWLRELAGDRLDARARLVAAIESSSALAPREAPTLLDEGERPPHTSVSVAADREKSPLPRRASWAWVAVGGIALGGGIATAAVLARPGPRSAPSASSAPAVPAPPIAEEAAPSPSLAPPLPQVSASPPPASASAPVARPAPRPARPRTPPAPGPAPTGTGLYGRE
ncbi:MAG TPA: serine/threonine-protein kinase [Polyangiaceae bacterium]|jgi:serine/threonine-protein kinase